MKDVFVKDLQPNTLATFFAACTAKDSRLTKSQKPYLAVTFRDKTGEIEGRIWDDVEAAGAGWGVGDVVKIYGEVSLYQGVLQIIVQKIRKAWEEEVELADYLPVSERNLQVEYDYIWSRLHEREDGVLRAVTLSLWERERERILKAPAAKHIHHAYVGGLLDHIHNMVSAADALTIRGGVYDSVDRDLLLAGIIWHDIGKLDELSVGLAFEYTTRGSLVGHIAIALGWLQREAESYGVIKPAPQIELLEHLILSHHGCREYGSPVVPAIPEAILLHYLDELDAKMEAAHVALAGEVDANGMTPWVKALDTRLYRRPNGE